jgi:type VI secretion system protein VasI
MNPKKIIGGILLGAVILWLIGTMASNSRRSQAAESTPPPPADKWQISESHSQMDDSRTVVLTLDSDDEIHGPLGAVRPSLIVRCKEKQTAAYVVTGMAANIETDSEGGPSDYHTVRIRLDDSPANAAQWSESTDHHALFAKDLYYGDRLETIIDFAKKLAGASTLTFQFTPFDGSPQVARFDLRGLDVHLHKLAEACGWAY